MKNFDLSLRAVGKKLLLFAALIGLMVTLSASGAGVVEAAPRDRPTNNQPTNNQPTNNPTTPEVPKPGAGENINDSQTDGDGNVTTNPGGGTSGGGTSGGGANTGGGGGPAAEAEKALGMIGGANNNITLMDAITSIIKVILFIVGALAVVMIIYSGIQYLLSAGDSAKVEKAKNTIMYAIVGLVVAIAAYAIVTWVVSIFEGSGGSGGGSSQQSSGDGESSSGSGTRVESPASGSDVTVPGGGTRPTTPTTTTTPAND